MHPSIHVILSTFIQCFLSTCSVSEISVTTVSKMDLLLVITKHKQMRETHPNKPWHEVMVSAVVKEAEFCGRSYQEP